jgi:hypothetical protein
MAHTKVTKTYSQNTGVANTFSYSGSFDVFKGTEVVALLDNVVLTYKTAIDNESASPRQYTVDTVAKTIHIGGADLSSGTVIIRPETDLGSPTPRAEFTPGASITSSDLNNNQTQLLRRAMEYEETVLFNTGGVMTGDLGIGEDQTIYFEGATDNTYETTLTVVDPTADRTITLPNVTGTVVTTGDTATVTATMLAANSVDSSELVDGSVDNSHLADDAVDSEEIAAGAIDHAHMSVNSVGEHQYIDASIKTAHIANDQIDSQHYAAGSIDLEHMSSASVDSDNIVDDTIVNADINSAAAIAHSKLANVTDGQILVGSGSNVPTAVAVSGDLTLANTGAFTIGGGAVTGGKLAADAVSGDKIADDQINSEHYAAGSIDNEHLADDAVGADELAANAVVNASVASNAAIDHSKLAAVTSGNILVGNGSNQAASVAMSGDVAIAASGATTIQANSVEIGMIGCEQTTISDSDSHIPTSGAVVDYVTDRIGPIGGLEVIADDESFPNTIPPAGVVISITDCAGLQVNSSGVSTNGDAVDNSTITINGFPSELRGGVGGNADPYVFGAGAGLMVQSTGSSHTYNYHQALIRESDFVQLSDDINDFNSRYRIGTRTANNSNTNDDGDLFFDTGTNKMYVYDGAYDSGGEWKEVTSAGDYKFLTIKTNGQAHDGSLTFDGSATQFDLFDGTSDASITSAAQLIVVLNGVVQKPNSGSWDTNEEGFYLDGSDGIRFCDGPPSGSVCFVTQIGTATTLSVPADDSVTSAKIQDGAVDTDQLAADAVEGSKIADDAVGAEHIEQLDADLSFADSAKAKFGTDNDLSIYHAAGSNVIEGNGTADIVIKDSTHTSAIFDTSAEVQLYYDNAKKFETTSAGATVTGVLTATLADNSIDSDHYVDGSIDNAHLADNAVDLAEMAHGTQGDILYYAASGVPTRLGAGTDGHFLKTQGGSANPVWAAASGGVTSDANDNTLGGSNAGADITAGQGLRNTFYGSSAGRYLTTGDDNIAIGSSALIGTNSDAVTGSNNVCVGSYTGDALIGGSDNVCVGYAAGTSLTSGGGNTLLGDDAGAALTTGGSNVAIGRNALLASTYRNSCVAVGEGTLQAMTDGYSNVAVGGYALNAVVAGYQNTALGEHAGRYITSGDYNTCLGRYGGAGITEGNNNVAVGPYALMGTVTGNNNNAVGYQALTACTSGHSNNSLGFQAGDSIITGYNCTCLGHGSDTTSDASTNQFVLGNSSVTLLRCQETSITSLSDERDKTDITNLPLGLDFLNKIRPVKFKWNSREGMSRDGSYEAGFIAQELQKVEDDAGVASWMKLVHDENPERLEATPGSLLPVLVNAIKELSTKNDALEARIAALEAA